MTTHVFPLVLVKAALQACRVNAKDGLGQRTIGVAYSETFKKPMLVFANSLQKSTQMCNLTREQQTAYLKKTGRSA